MKDRLCGCSFIHPQRSLKQGLETIQRLGFSTVDIGVGGGNAHYDAVVVAQQPQAFADEVRHETEKLQLEPNECFLLNFGAPLNTPIQEERARTLELFTGLTQGVKAAGFKSILVIAGPTYTELGQAASLELSALALTDLVKVCGDNNLQLNLEADSESCAHTPEAAAQLCRSVPGLGLTLDYSHFICQGIAAERVAVLHPYTRHIHIRQAAPGQIVAEVDEGTIDFSQVTSQLERSGYNGLYCIEYLSFANDAATLIQSEKRTLAMSREMKDHLAGLKE